MPDSVTAQIPRANLAALIHATEEPSVHQSTTARMPVVRLEALLEDERKTTAAPVNVTVHAELRERPPLPMRLFLAVGLLSGISVGLACLWA